MTGTFYVGRNRKYYSFFKSSFKTGPKLVEKDDSWDDTKYTDWNREVLFEFCDRGIKKHFGGHFLKNGEVKKITITFGGALETVAK